MLSDGRFSEFGNHKWMSSDWINYIPDERDVGRYIILGNFEIERAQIPQYFTEEIFKAIAFYKRYVRHGFPYGGGWAQQPAKAFDIIDALSLEQEKINAERQS